MRRTAPRPLVVRRFDGELAPFTYLFDHPDVSIVMLHGSIGVLKDFALNYQHDKSTYFIINFPWYQSTKDARKIGALLSRIEAASPGIIQRCLFLSNSEWELQLFRAINPGLRSEKVNNCFTLSEKLFYIEDHQPEYEFVCNATPLKYKNHRFLPPIKQSALISWDHNITVGHQKNRVDLSTLCKGELMQNLNCDQVREILNKSCCGVILSGTEGACYASAEYLLCGIPVVSCPSFGGRDEYYNMQNSFVVPLKKEEISQAIQNCVSGMRAGMINRRDIRTGILDKQIHFRKLLSTALEKMTGLNKDMLYAYITEKIHQESKMWSSIIYWSDGLHSAASTLD